MGSKKDLIDTIERQQDKLSKYETRLRDVVQAYKGLVKEKEALEASLNALNTAKPVEAVAKNELDSAKCKEQNEDGSAEACDPSEQNNQLPPAGSEDDTLNQLQHQITILTSSLSTLSAEKARIEASFQADKKRLMQEKDECDNRLAIEKEENSKSHEEIMKELNDVKNKLKMHQQERDKDESNHGLMLRELQKLVSSERISKEYLQEKLDEAQTKLKKKEEKLDKAAEYEKKLQEMSDQLISMRERLQISEEMVNKPSPMLFDLQNQMIEMKAQHQISFEQEKLRANEAERKLANGSDANESRVAALELKLSELSDLIGNYDRMRMKDQMAIAKLKDRVTQLDLENTALAKAACKATDSTGDNFAVNERDLSVQELIDRISKLKNLLRIANKKAEIPVNIDDILKVDFLKSLPNQVEEDHSQCQSELKKIVDEFEKYKLRAQSVLKNKNSKDNDATKEINQLTNQVSEMKDKILILQSQLEDEEIAHKASVTDLKNSLTRIENFYKKQIYDIEEDFKAKIRSIEQQMQQQRERTIAVLEEKEEELNILRSSNKYGNEKRHKRNSSSDEKSRSPVGADGNKEGKNGDGDEVISMLSNAKKTSKSETQILHYQQEVSRLNVEVKQLRKTKRNLESSLRELQGTCSSKEEKYCDEIDELKSKMSRLELTYKKGMNLEYLKNVVLNFIRSTDPVSKLHMLNAIAAVLHFTSKELSSAKPHVNSQS